MKYFYVYAETTLPVFSNGTVDCDFDHAQDNITKYYVDEMDETGMVLETKEYREEDFKKIEQDHPSSEWQNNQW